MDHSLTIEHLVSKETVCCVGGKVANLRLATVANLPYRPCG